MSQEIVEAVREIEREKGIEHGTLQRALEDALLAAYKKTPGAARHATVELDERGRLPRLLDRPARRTSRSASSTRPASARIQELERLEAENGERTRVLINDDGPRGRLAQHRPRPRPARGRHAATTSAASPRRRRSRSSCSASARPSAPCSTRSTSTASARS